MKKLVSVIMPVCNCGKYTQNAVDSILNQTYKEIELIVVDSSDNEETLQILHSYGDKIKLFHTSRNGIANALNFGLEKATGEYIARMDADDISLPKRIEMQVNYLENHPEVGLLSTDTRLIDENNNFINLAKEIRYSDSEIKARLIFGNCIVHPTVMFREKLVRDGWRYDSSFFAEDFDLWTRMAAKGIVFASLPEKLLWYRQYDNNSSANYDKVIPSVNKSGLSYVEEFFHLEHGKFCLENFTRSYYNFPAHILPEVFLDEHLLLLNTIYEQNKKLKKISEKHLIKELNDRWNWVYWYCIRPYISFIKDDSILINLSGSPTEVYFFENLKKNCGTSDVNLIRKKICTSVKKARTMYNTFFNSSSRIIIYGLGIRGEKLLTQITEGNAAKKINCNIIAVADKEKKTCTICGHQYTTVSPKEILNLNFDGVIVSSQKYYKEIREDLIKIGIMADKIFAVGAFPL